MKRFLKSLYFFLPVQLFLLHFRKYQLLLAFWLILLLIIRGNIASHFGASSLLLAPEYLGNISFASMLLLGCSVCVFTMMWHITTFIIHSKRIPFMGATRHAFLIYSLNNSIIPVLFLIYYSIVSVHFQLKGEHSTILTIIVLQLGFYLGYLLVILLSFMYFFRVSRDFFKTLLTRIANPARIRGIIPYDSLDYEIDIIPASTFITGRFHIEETANWQPYHPRVMGTILRRHHRNVIFATVVAYLILLVLGIYIEHPYLRIPAGAGFLLLFSIMMGVVGAFKYFLKSWEAIGWVFFVLFLGVLVKYKVFDLRSIAFGLNYHQAPTQQPIYDYYNLRHIFNKNKFEADKNNELVRLNNWKAHTGQNKPPLIIVSVSGGGSRSAYWTLRSLQYLDSASGGNLFKNTVLVTGASGGMIGAAYWRSIHDAHQQGIIKDPYLKKYLDNQGKDLLNAIIFSFASVDMVSPFNKINVGRYSYTRDRGYAMEQEMINNTEGLLDKNIGYFKQREHEGIIPQVIVSGTIVNDGRKLLISAQPITYLTRPVYSLNDPFPAIDAVDFAALFAGQDPYNLRFTSALRMNATFPVVLPVVKLPSQPAMNIMDAGLSDNFGSSIAARYLYVLRDWIKNNTGNVIVLEIRDTQEFDVCSNSDQATLGKMLFDPLFTIQNNWEGFQSYSFGNIKEYAPSFLEGKLRFVKLEYMPKAPNKMAALNFHLTQTEKEDIYQSIQNTENLAAIDTILKLVRQER